MVPRSIPRHLLLISFILLIAPALFAQQTGSIAGTVTTEGVALPGVTVEARSNVLPQPRVVVTDSSGQYRFVALPPGSYTLTYSLAGMQTRTRNVQVYLNVETPVNVQLGVEALAETITVTAETPLIDPSSTAIKDAISSQQIEDLPTGQEYRDLVKLIPAVAHTENVSRGPSAGGSGQDNMYQFDGVNVTLPLFGVLSAEPSTHDIAQMSVIKGGAKAVDFNRSGGITIDTVSKSGTNQWMGELSYEFQNASMIADRDREIVLQGDRTRSWALLNAGGPILRDRLFFFGSYYRPEVERENASNVFGEVPNFRSVRNELFGKLTFTPTQNILLHGSYRDATTDSENDNIGGFSAVTRGVSNDSSLQIGILEASWVMTPRSHATFKFTNFANETAGVPDVLLDTTPSIALGTRLDIANLERMGAVSIPSPIAGRDEFNAFIAPLIERYGYIGPGGERIGGVAIGAASQINDQDFFRTNWQVGYNYLLGSNVTHDLHVGYQWYVDEEDLRRASNAWGAISVVGGRSTCPSGTECAGQPIFYEARFLRSTGDVAGNLIHSELESQSFEINDTIRWNQWMFNAGVIFSNDTLFGQGLRNDPSTESGFVLSPGTQYEMYEIPWEKQIQPRLGVTWSYNNVDTIYAAYAKYNPPATSLPRAASWDRNLLNFFFDAFFDAEGVLIGSEPVGSSSGKLFVEDLDPRYTDEYLIGTSRQLTPSFAGRVYARHRYSTNFWEDTNNNARVDFEAPADIPHELYIPNLNDMRRQICASNKEVCTGTLSGSSYVIAELDGAFTKYYEATVEGDWRVGPAFFRGSYTWSQYYGNFDQDNTTVNNDQPIFIGSSNIADGPGRQVWDNKYGWLAGDRRHLLKFIGSYRLPWNASAGAYAVYQSGEPWEAWSFEPYSHLTRSTSSTIRFAEPAGSRRSPSHYQVDLKYSQSIPMAGLALQLDLDVFNVLDNQTGYSINPFLTSNTFGQPRSFYSPRRYEVAARLKF